jgi:hypothetical protein
MGRKNEKRLSCFLHFKSDQLHQLFPTDYQTSSLQRFRYYATKIQSVKNRSEIAGSNETYIVNHYKYPVLTKKNDFCFVQKLIALGLQLFGCKGP